MRQPIPSTRFLLALIEAIKKECSLLPKDVDALETELLPLADEDKKQLIKKRYPKKIENILVLADKIVLEKNKADDREKDKEKTKSFLQDERPQYQSLGCGVHNGDYYFGTKLWKEGMAYTAIITNKKELHINKRIKIGGVWVGDNEIKQNFGLNYKDDFFDEGLDFIFTSKAIERFLYEDTADITVKNIFDKLLTTLKKYQYFENETKYKVVVLWRIAGYFMHIWKARARLFIHAEMGSGKSRLTSILHNTGFNSVSLADWTLPFLQRMIESTRGETHIDDFESLDEEKQKATIRLVKTGYMKGFKAGKTGDKSRRPEVYDLFNTTTINNTEGIDWITNDRCITIRIPKIEDAGYDNEPNFKEPIWQEIRDELYILGLKEAKKVNDVYSTINSEKLKGRLFSIFKPELTIAKIISEDLFTEVENWWKEEIEQRDSKELSDDWEYKAFEKIVTIVLKQKNEDYFFLYNDVVKPVIEEMYPEDEKKYKFRMSKTIGNILSRNPIFKKRTLDGKKQYKVKGNELEALLKAKKWPELISETTSTTSTTSTTPTKSLTSTTQKLVEVVEVSDVSGQEPASLRDFIKQKDEGSGAYFGEVVSQFGEDAVHTALAKGEVFQPKPDRLKVLE
jgi:hypothetical protein